MPPAYLHDPTLDNTLSVSSASNITFLTPATTQTVSSWPQVLAAAELTNDNLTDLAIATNLDFDPANDERLHLLAQTVGGNLLFNNVWTAGQNPKAMVSTDLSHDTQPDVAVALAGAKAVALYTQNGGLQGPTLLPLDHEPNALTALDFSGDLRNDLAVALPHLDTLTLLTSSPNGLTTTTTLPYPTSGFDALDTGDFNNDGFDDLVALNGAGPITDSLVVYLQVRGTFPLSQTLTPHTTGGYLPHSVAAGDLNNDGLDDLVVTTGGNTPDAYISVFLQDEDGLDPTPIVYDAYDIPSATLIRDLNHDGLNDVVLLNDGWLTLSYYPQLPNNSLDSTYQIAALPYASYHFPDGLEVADLNNDGGLDIGIVGHQQDLTLLYSTLTAPVATIETPVEAAIVPPGPMLVTGVAAANTITVEVRLKGETDWQIAQLDGTDWEIEFDLPAEDRPWTIEARAIDAAGRYQAPPARRRVQVANHCYAVADNEHLSGSPDRLMLINKVTAEATLIGNTGTRSVEALALKPNSDQLYASNAHSLGRLNPTTGVFAAIQEPFGTGDGSQGEILFCNVDGLAFDPADEALFGVHHRRRGTQDLLIKIDPSTGRFIPDAFGPGLDYVEIDGAGVLDNIGDIAFDPITGLLYSTSLQPGQPGLLVTIDKTTGLATAIGSLDAERMEGLSFSGDALYGTTNEQGPAAERNHLYSIDPSTGLASAVGPISQQKDYEAIACLAPAVLAAAPNLAPTIEMVTINGDTFSTSDPTISLTVPTASDNIRWLYVQEYALDPATGQWQISPSPASLSTASVDPTPGWQPFELGKIYEWTLSQAGGLKYVQVWGSDQAGNLSHLGYQAPINYTPATSSLDQDAIDLYRVSLTEGQQLTVQLTSSTGDTDLYIWPADFFDGWPAWVSNQPTGPDRISITAPVDGIYQIEIHGYSAATYHLDIDISDTPATEETNPHTGKSPPTAPSISIFDEPSVQDAPTPPFFNRYLPMIVK